MKQFELNGFPCIVPESWHEVSYRQAVDFEAWRVDGTSSIPRLIEIFTGCPQDTTNAAATLQVNLCLGLMGFVLAPMAWADLTRPDALLIGGHAMLVQANMELWPYGATVDLHNALKAAAPAEDNDPQVVRLDFGTTESNDVKMLKAGAKAVALALQAGAGTYAPAELAALTDKVMQLPAVDVYPLVAFFLTAPFRSRQNGTTTTPANTSQKKKRPGLNALKNLGALTSFGRWLRGT